MSTQINSSADSTNLKNSAIGIAAATAGGTLTYQAGRKLLGIPIKKMQTNLLAEATAQNSVFKDAAIKALNDNNIKHSNLRTEFDFIFDIDVMEFFMSKQKKPLNKLTNKLKDLERKILPELILKAKDKKISKKMSLYSDGANACCLGDKVFANFDKLSVATFHEGGHAKNYSSKLGKFLQNLRAPIVSKSLLGIAFASAILLPKKTKEEKADLEKNDNLMDKGLNFAKENCVGIALAGTLPEVLEEGLATYKGNKMAKEVLSIENYKKVKSFNRKALLIYGAKAALITGAVFAASKIRDYFTTKNEPVEKQEQIA